MFRGAPKMFRGAPEIFRGTPKMFRGTPKMFRGTPKMFRGAPEIFRGAPEIFRGTPKMFRGAPEIFRGAPEMFRGAPKMFRGAPKMFRGALLGAGSSLRRVRSKAPALQRSRFCKAVETGHALSLLLRRRLEAGRFRGVPKIVPGAPQMKSGTSEPGYPSLFFIP
jgi:uncharacterized protein (DUF924 family)